ncbi:MAG: hypothetical protein NT026_01955 [Candidatus Staskawiczbacteria bacterium]|nr:hypothetical protein [Candidatus Staskawiczbacteria bacterium]
MKFKSVKTSVFCLIAFSFLACGFFAAAQQNPVGAATDDGTVNVAQESGNNRIAPGEFLPISIKLVNFGSQKRVDVVVNYKILDSDNKEIYSESETVAVETTASFVKRIQLPYTIKSGLYSFVSILNYPDQQQPAESKFPFRVEEKIGSFFKSDLIFYSITLFSIILVVIVLTYLFTALNKKRSVISQDYTDKPKSEIIYYEILGDVISQMRLRIGDDALEIAKGISDLEINDKNGMVVNIKKNPARIVALLIDRYEEMTGNRVSFSLPQNKKHN